MSDKIAILLAGPSRYINSTIKRIELLKNKKIIDYYIFLWEGDNGNKQRDMEEEFDNLWFNKLSVVFFAKASPFSEKSYNSYFPNKTEKNQSIASNIMGMFQSMRILASHLDASTTNYNYILRLRTDCILISDEIFKDDFLFENKTLISMNYLIPYTWVSDHMMLTDKQSFIKIWTWSTSSELYKEYQKSDMNPEKLLSRKMKSLSIKPSYLWKRYLDYQIVYFPIKETEPYCINNFLKTSTVEGLYEGIDNIIASNQSDLIEYIKPQKINQDYYAKPKLIKFYLKLKKALTELL